MDQKRVFFRADGNAKMGLGHVFRSLALVQMLNEDFECYFIIQNPLEALAQNIIKVCKSIIRLEASDDIEKEAEGMVENILNPDDIVVLDGYHFRTNYQKIIRDKGCKLVCIDDIHNYHFVADAVINHAPGLNPEDYSVEAYTRLCFGLDFTLLRAPFLEAAKKEREISAIASLFICFGGSDFKNITLKVLKSVIEKPDLFKSINIVLGGAFSHQEEIDRLIRENPKLPVNLYRNLSAKEMVDLMQACQLAIVPASSILYEVIAVKMPVISGFYVDNQVDVYKGFKKLGLIYGINDFSTFDHYIELIEIIQSDDPKEIMSNQKKHLSGAAREHFLDLFKSL